MTEFDFTEVSFWEVRPEFLPNTDEICEYAGGTVFVMMAVAGVVTHQSPDILLERLEKKGIVTPLTQTVTPLAA